jgi:hypothetical protein
METISDHITYAEATHTSTGLPNSPNEEQLEAMKLVSEFLFEKLRAYIDEPIIVDSFFRSQAVNDAVGGVNTSQHCKGEAIDIKAPLKAGYTNADLFHYIKDKLTFDQLIWEHGDLRNPAWVHVSYSGKHNRNEVLRSVSTGAKTIYLKVS